ncbi:hypothetical protein FNW02_28930 [Komarekiella sp. 'clone 1']|uniref:Uncharacterized protein n=1 Tax=Komarekiella delphini-convector SJRDD-AB1 TaxID=2593771 RepID=A0AA40T2H6_9NOST|nr:hypothetical protein [Komarekiella delphini-convector]MBD6619731.1 hypothetical protein [Komarekiella delphini-convector SJRDD-AB1]
MPRKPKAVPLSKVEDIQTSLKQKAATPKTIGLSDLVQSLAKPIQDMLDAGYSYEDVSDVFKGHGVELAASGLKGFHKKAFLSTDNISSNKSSDKAIDESVDGSESSSLTLESTVTNDEVPSIEPDSSSTNSSEPSDYKTTQQGKRKKPTTKTSAQFNVTDRSNV